MPHEWWWLKEGVIEAWVYGDPENQTDFRCVVVPQDDGTWMVAGPGHSPGINFGLNLEEAKAMALVRF